ncbi:hypothetical protein GCM10023231_41640 [Olivibacter ginsenosidimutans]|uniref:Uncharacterized protein n=1 Tax=Olivibacter ginsenosidimutans TaxID=1176537 RepID=A0ABP9CEJ9_9SPHI
MLKKLVFNLLLVVTATILLVKPLIGFNLYHRAKQLAVDEFITVIKAFSKRKQDYIYGMDADCHFISPQNNPTVLQPICYLASFLYEGYAVMCTFSAVLLRKILHKSSLYPRLYLLHGRLSL